MYDYTDYGAMEYGMMEYGTMDSNIAIGMFAFILLVSLVVWIVEVVSTWRLFAKAGQPGWASIIPIYNIYVLFQITWGQGSRFLLLFIPIYNIILAIQTNIKLAKAFGKSTGFGIGLIFLRIIMLPMLAFGNSTYLGVPNP